MSEIVKLKSDPNQWSIHMLNITMTPVENPDVAGQRLVFQLQPNNRNHLSLEQQSHCILKNGECT